jgi:hypothetical protein
VTSYDPDEMHHWLGTTPPQRPKPAPGANVVPIRASSGGNAALDARSRLGAPFDRELAPVVGDPADAAPVSCCPVFEFVGLALPIVLDLSGDLSGDLALDSRGDALRCHRFQGRSVRGGLGNCAVVDIGHPVALAGAAREGAIVRLHPGHVGVAPSVHGGAVIAVTDHEVGRQDFVLIRVVGLVPWRDGGILRAYFWAACNAAEVWHALGLGVGIGPGGVGCGGVGCVMLFSVYQNRAVSPAGARTRPAGCDPVGDELQRLWHHVMPKPPTSRLDFGGTSSVRQEVVTGLLGLLEIKCDNRGMPTVFDPRLRFPIRRINGARLMYCATCPDGVAEGGNLRCEACLAHEKRRAPEDLAGAAFAL